MHKPLALYLGIRFAKAKQSNLFVSFVTFISIIGLTLGVAVLITVTSVMNGFDRELRDRILGMVPQAAVGSSTILQDWPVLMAQLQKDPDVLAAAPYIQIQSMITANGQVAGAVVTGIVPTLENKVSIVNKHMSQGSLAQITGQSYNMVLGQGLADSLGVGVGDKVTMVLPEASTSVAGIVPRFKRFTVTGVFNVGADIDSIMAYISLDDAAKLLRLPSGAQGIRLKVTDLFAAPDIASRAVASQPGRNLYPTDWTQTHGNLFSAIQLEKALVGLLLFLIVLVATFNIVSSLVMVVADKKSEIAILRTMGADSKLITRVFMVQGMFIGWIGTLLGTILGLIIAFSIGGVVGFINDFFQLNLFSAYFIHYLPSEVRWSNVATIMVVSLILSFVVTLRPARTAANVQPAEALRYE